MQNNTKLNRLIIKCKNEQRQEINRLSFRSRKRNEEVKTNYFYNILNSSSLSVCCFILFYRASLFIDKREISRSELPLEDKVLLLSLIK